MARNINAPIAVPDEAGRSPLPATDRPRVSVFGLGYVGVVSCGCFANDGFSVVGVDVNPAKVESLGRGQSPIIEDRIGDLIGEGVNAGRLRATEDVGDAVRSTDVSVISVGTPSRTNGAVELGAVLRVSEQIGRALAAKPGRHLVIVRSTVPPGTVRGVVIPALERSSGKQAGVGFGVCFNPEFLREGSSVQDHYDPPFTIVGSDDEEDARRAAALYSQSNAPVYVTSIETAEMVKYVCNAFHGLKITFANEIGILSHALGVDAHAVMDLVCRDTKLNISPKYLKPGLAFGGSCLPKDLRSLTQQARARDLRVPLLDAILESNRTQIERALQMITSLGRKRVSLLGLSFKAGTDDLRESPLVTLAEAMIGKGFDLRIYDGSVLLTRLVGANKEYIEKGIPHIGSLLVETLPEAIAHADVLIVGNGAPEFGDLPAMCRPGQAVIDLVRIPGLSEAAGIEYHGLMW